MITYWFINAYMNGGLAFGRQLNAFKKLKFVKFYEPS